jgi:hypothetical protein
MNSNSNSRLVWSSYGSASSETEGAIVAIRLRNVPSDQVIRAFGSLWESLTSLIFGQSSSKRYQLVLWIEFAALIQQHNASGHIWRYICRSVADEFEYLI